MKKNPAVAFLLLFAILASGRPTRAAAQPVGVDAARAQADAFLVQARSSLAAGAQSDASDLVAAALQLAPDYSEALYLRAELELTDRARTLGAMDDLRRAIAGGSWTLTDPSAARKALAGLLLRMGRLPEAQDLLVPLAAQDPSDPEAPLLLAMVYERDGNTGALRRLLTDAEARFPLEDRFALIAAGALEREGRRSAARQLIATQLDVHPGSLALLLRAAELEPGPAARVAAVDRYAGRGGKDPLAAVLALEAAAGNPQKYLSQFIDNGGLSREDLVERVAAAVRAGRGLTAAFRSALSRFSGNRDLDPQGDGYYQERWVFDGGSLVSWVRDTHKDGLPEYTAGFKGGMPVSLTVRTGADTILTLSYNTYPFVDSAKLSTPGGETARTFLLVPYEMKFPFLASQTLPVPAGLAPLATRTPGSPSVDQILRSSYIVEDLNPEGGVTRRTDLLRGKPVFMEEKTQAGIGAFDHLVWYENGQPVRGERDLDGSGRFSVSETWRDGRLAGIAVDTNGDGKVDYRERYLPSPMKSWDYDEDGVDDAREYPAGPDTVVRDFSTGRNGVFDVSYVWKKGDLVRATIRGHAVAVTHDAARGVVWIGPPAPASVPVDAGSAEGYRTISGSRYLVFRQEGVTYMEELP